MKLSPRETEKLMLHNAGFLAQKRLARGSRLNYTEVVALIATQILEFVYDGDKIMVELMDIWTQLLGRRHVLPTVPHLLDSVQVEGTFPDGTKLTTIHDPIFSENGNLELALHDSFLPKGSPLACKTTREAYANIYGPTVRDKIHLGDIDLFTEVKKDFAVYRDECVFGGGKVIRDGMGKALGYRVSTEVIAGERKIVTAGTIDCHVHFICPQLAYKAIASGITTLIRSGPDLLKGHVQLLVSVHMKLMLQGTDDILMLASYFLKYGQITRKRRLRNTLSEQRTRGKIRVESVRDDVVWKDVTPSLDECDAVSRIYGKVPLHLSSSVGNSNGTHHGGEKEPYVEKVYPMYKAFIQPGLKTTHINIVNKLNPFTGFQSPSYLLKGEAAENEGNDVPNGSRFSAVIEKIEHLYMVCNMVSVNRVINHAFFSIDEDG
ncbi:urease isoform X1 [Tanacetum coccineum]